MQDDYDTPRAENRSLFIPFILLAVSLLLFLIWQIGSVQSQRAGFKTTKAQLAEAIQKREPQAAQATEIKARLEGFANDLLEIAKTDQNAAAVVKKYDIQRNLTAATEAGK